MIKTLTRAALTAALAAIALSAPASADRGDRQYRGGGGSAVVFKDPNFRGAALSINGAIDNLAYERFNDTISSVRLNGAWELCTDPNFRGRCEIVDGSINHLSVFRLNDNITSMRPVNGSARRHDNRNQRDYGYNDRRDYDRGRGAAIRLFRDPNFRGEAIGFDGAVDYLKYAGFNDRASSIIVNSGRWVVCEDPNYRGRCEVVEGRVGELTWLRLNDRISSLRPFRRGRDAHLLNRNTGDYRYGDNGYGQYGRNDNRYGGARDVGYGRDRYNRSYQFDDPRDRFGNRIPARRGNALAFCQENGFSRVDEVETTRRGYLGCVICSR